MKNGGDHSSIQVPLQLPRVRNNVILPLKYIISDVLQITADGSPAFLNVFDYFIGEDFLGYFGRHLESKNDFVYLKRTDDRRELII